MTNPTIPDASQQSSPSARSRPAGERGGHTVQDWEQTGAHHDNPVLESSSRFTPVARSASATVEVVQSAVIPVESVQSPAESAAIPVESIPGLFESAPNPAVTPIYLRPAVIPVGGQTPSTAEPVTAEAVAAPVESLADAITRNVMESLTTSLHQAVISAVRALAPNITIGFPATATTAKPVVARGADEDIDVASAPNVA